MAALNALAKARNVLSSRIRDPKVKFVPGLAEDLRAIMDALDELDRRTAVIAAVVLRKHYWPASAIHNAQLTALIEMGTEPETVARIGRHGEGCICCECMPISGVR